MAPSVIVVDVHAVQLSTDASRLPPSFAASRELVYSASPRRRPPTSRTSACGAARLSFQLVAQSADTECETICAARIVRVLSCGCTLSTGSLH